MGACSQGVRKYSIFCMLVLVLVGSICLFGWSFYELDDRTTTHSCTGLPNYPIVYANNGDYCAWKIWPNSITRLASSALAVFIALVTMIALAKEIRSVFMTCTSLFVLDAVILLVSVIVDGLSVTAVRDGETCFGTTECDLKMLYIAPATTGVLFLITAPMATTMIWYLCHMNRKQDKREVDPSSYEHLLRVKDSRF